MPPPALRGLFARGVAPGAIKELKAVFAAAPGEEHQDLAKSLEGVTRKQAMAIGSILRNNDATLYEAIEIVLLEGANDRLFHIRRQEDQLQVDEEAPQESSSSHGSKRAPAPLFSSIPSPGDKEELRQIAATTGGSMEMVKRLSFHAQKLNATPDELIFACEYSPRIGAEEDAIRLAQSIAAKPTVYGTLRKYLRMKWKSISAAYDLDDDEERKFLLKIVV